MATMRPKAARKSKTIHFRIDKFEDLDGPVLIRVVTKPVQKGRPSEEVFFDWVDDANFSVTLRASQNFPVSVRGMRSPMDVAEGVQSRELKVKIERDNVNTWPSELVYRGWKDCHDHKYCNHEELTNGRYSCPRPVELPVGLVWRNDEVIVLREDGPPAPESKLKEMREAESAKRGEIKAKLDRIAEEAKSRVRGPEPAPVAAPPLGEGRSLGTL